MLSRRLAVRHRLLAMLVVLSVTFLGSRYGRAQEESNVNWRWAFGAQLSSENDKTPKLVSITQDMPLKTGDQLKMLVELQKPCFVYVIHHGPGEKVRWLFPYTMPPFENDYTTGKRYDIPEGKAWFKLNEEVGRETFYVLASVERLSDLETLLTSYASASAADKPQIAGNIVAAIRDVKKRYRQFSTLAERPVPIAGNLRGPDLADLAIEIKAHNFYSKTFTIEHR